MTQELLNEKSLTDYFYGLAKTWSGDLKSASVPHLDSVNYGLIRHPAKWFVVDIGISANPE